MYRAADCAEEHGFLEADQRASSMEGMGHTVVHVPSLSPCSSWRLHLVGLDGAREEQCNWCAACGGQYNWKDPNRVLLKQDSADPSKANVFRAHAPPQGACENLVLRAETASWTRSWKVCRSTVRLKIMDELMRFIDVDNHEAVKIGDLEKHSEAIKVGGPGRVWTN